MRVTLALWRLLLSGVIAAAASACSAREPTDAQLRATFEEHRVALDELRQLFDEDVKQHRLAKVTAKSANQTRCENRRDGEPCLSTDRWREYASRLRRTGILWIERHETPGFYFNTFRSPVWTEAFRFRGLVYAPGWPRVIHNHDDTEERVDLGDGWYLYLIIDT